MPRMLKKNNLELKFNKMKKLLLLLLCVPMIFSCGSADKEEIINLVPDRLVEVSSDSLDKEEFYNCENEEVTCGTAAVMIGLFTLLIKVMFFCFIFSVIYYILYIRFKKSWHNSPSFFIISLFIHFILCFIFTFLSFQFKDFLLSLQLSLILFIVSLIMILCFMLFWRMIHWIISGFNTYNNKTK